MNFKTATVITIFTLVVLNVVTIIYAFFTLGLAVFTTTGMGSWEAFLMLISITIGVAIGAASTNQK